MCRLSDEPEFLCSSVYIYIFFNLPKCPSRRQAAPPHPALPRPSLPC